MSNSIRHRRRRYFRAKQKKKENRQHRNASRNKRHLIDTRQPIPMEVIEQEIKQRRSLWKKIKDFFKELFKRR